MKKKSIGVIFGGISNEHEISCLSVINVVSGIDTEKWDISLIGITREGSWLLAESTEDILDGSWTESRLYVHMSLSGDRCIIIDDGSDTIRRRKLDVCFPVLHGLGGEDGTIQGLFETAGMPYVGCGVLSSAVSMDKFYTKAIISHTGIRQAEFAGVRSNELLDEASLSGIVESIEERLGYPVFIKPSRSGSSVGVSKASDRDSLIEGLKKAAITDSKILVEEFIDGREIESAVLRSGSGETLVSGVGEILAAAEFYDYDAKYNNPDSLTVTDPDLPEETVDEIRKSAARIFDEVDGYGLARVDFFVSGRGEVIFNEINTIPGFTAISMYPMLWEKRGISRTELMERLIQSAFER